MYGVDWEEPTPFSVAEPDRVEIPEIQVVQCEHLECLNPLQRSDIYGMDLYERAKQLLCKPFNIEKVAYDFKLSLYCTHIYVCVCVCDAQFII